MSRLDTHDLTWGDMATAPETNPTHGQGAGNGTFPPESDCGGWVSILDHSLGEWAKDGGALADDGIEPPSAATIDLAWQVAQELREVGLPAPHRVAATGDGGIVFVRQMGPLLSTIEIDADGSVELIVLRNSRLVSRRRLC
jgi:hypothetical protein